MGGWHGDGDWMWHGGYGGGWILALVVGIAFIALAVAAIVVAVRYLGGGQQAAGRPVQGNTAEAILAERLARGEIDSDEFRQRMTALREHR